LLRQLQETLAVNVDHTPQGTPTPAIRTAQETPAPAAVRTLFEDLADPFYKIERLYDMGVLTDDERNAQHLSHLAPASRTTLPTEQDMTRVISLSETSEKKK
jgi:hypothetical protein